MFDYPTISDDVLFIVHSVRCPTIDEANSISLFPLRPWRTTFRACRSSRRRRSPSLSTWWRPTRTSWTRRTAQARHSRIGFLVEPLERFERFDSAGPSGCSSSLSTVDVVFSSSCSVRNGSDRRGNCSEIFGSRWWVNFPPMNYPGNCLRWNVAKKSPRNHYRNCHRNRNRKSSEITPEIARELSSLLLSNRSSDTFHSVRTLYEPCTNLYKSPLLTLYTPVFNLHDANPFELNRLSYRLI